MGRPCAEEHCFGEKLITCIHPASNKAEISNLIELRLLQVVPLKLGVKVRQSLHSKVIKKGKLLNLIGRDLEMNSYWCILTCSGVGLKSGVRLRRSLR